MADKRVLVVDDEVDVQEVVHFALELEGYAVEAAGNGLEALEAIERDAPGLVLLDMRMPVMDGQEFARQCRRRYGDGIPIVVMTAAADAPDRAREMGACGWLGKPFDLDALISLVRRHLKG